MWERNDRRRRRTDNDGRENCKIDINQARYSLKVGIT